MKTFPNRFTLHLKFTEAGWPSLPGENYEPGRLIGVKTVTSQPSLFSFRVSGPVLPSEIQIIFRFVHPGRWMATSGNDKSRNNENHNEKL